MENNDGKNTAHGKISPAVYIKMYAQENGYSITDKDVAKYVKRKRYEIRRYNLLRLKEQGIEDRIDASIRLKNTDENFELTPEYVERLYQDIVSDLKEFGEIAMLQYGIADSWTQTEKGNARINQRLLVRYGSIFQKMTEQMAKYAGSGTKPDLSDHAYKKLDELVAGYALMNAFPAAK